jgi:glycerate 2-kinase
VRIVVAPDKFKGSLPAREVAAALAAGLLAGDPGLDVTELPVADGGDGTLAAALAAGFTRVPVTAEGPTCQPVESAIGLRGDTAVIELADVAGLQRLPGRALAPLTASTFGVGQLIAAALDQAAGTIILGLGGSASTDGGAGMMQALGVRLLGRSGRPVGRGGLALAGLAAVDAGGLDPRLACASMLLASDVDNPLLGPAGAAAVFGPQKGASADEVGLLDRALARWAELTWAVTGADVSGAPGAGAAGGTGYAALAYLGAAIRPGIDLVLELIGFDAAITRADLIITGEGSLDTQTLRGKAPAGVARAAARRRVPVLAVAGRSSLTEAELAAASLRAVYPLAALQPDPAASMRDAAGLLRRTGEIIARDLRRTGPYPAADAPAADAAAEASDSG